MKNSDIEINEYLKEAIRKKFDVAASGGFTEGVIHRIKKKKEQKHHRIRLYLLIFIIILIFIDFLFIENIRSPGQLFSTDYNYIRIFEGFTHFWEQKIVQIILFSISSTILLDMILRRKKKLKFT
jgi:hypothetical protein